MNLLGPWFMVSYIMSAVCGKNSLQVLYRSHFEVHTFILDIYQNMFECVNVCPLLQRLYSSSRPPPRKPSLLWLVSSQTPEQAPSTVFLHQLCQCFFFHNYGCAEGGDCIAVASQCYRSPRFEVQLLRGSNFLQHGPLSKMTSICQFQCLKCEDLLVFNIASIKNIL